MNKHDLHDIIIFIENELRHDLLYFFEVKRFFSAFLELLMKRLCGFQISCLRDAKLFYCSGVQYQIVLYEVLI